MSLQLFVCSSFLLFLVESVPPNIVLFLTDDQDLILGSTRALPKTLSWLRDDGASFNMSFSNFPLCCPSRSTILTGFYPHNHQVSGNSPSDGCYGIKWVEELERVSFASILYQNGYKTSYAGKYLNGYHFTNGEAQVPYGWYSWDGLMGGVGYYDYSLVHYNQKEDYIRVEDHKSDFDDDYLTNIILNRTKLFLDDVLEGSDPFLSVLSFTACHTPADPAPQYSTRFKNVIAPRTPNFNLTIKDSNWFERSQGAGYGLSSKSTISWIDLLYQRRLQTLLSVDDAVEQIILQIEKAGKLNSTYFMFTSDHGYHLGQASLVAGKRTNLETDIRIPLYVRGPGISAGTVVSQPVSLVDLAPTIVDMSLQDVDGWQGHREELPLPHSRSHSRSTNQLSRSVPLTHTPKAISDALADMDGSSLLPLLAIDDSSRGTIPSVAASQARKWRDANIVVYTGQPDDGGDGDRTCERTWGQNISCHSPARYHTPPYFEGPKFCYCQDCVNMTYYCLRITTLSPPHPDPLSHPDTTLLNDVLYCEYPYDFGIESVGNGGDGIGDGDEEGGKEKEISALRHHVEVYDMNRDPWQLRNLAHGLPRPLLSYLHLRMKAALACQGSEDCRLRLSNFRYFDSNNNVFDSF